MTVRISKPEFNLREKLTELDYGQVPLQKMPSGSVLQVVFAQTNAEATQNNAATTQTTLFFTNLEATISPRFSTSKILVTANQNFNITGPNVAQLQWNFYICNSSGTILQGAPGADSFDQNRIKDQKAHAGSHPIHFLHSPNTTSAFTYRVYGNNYYSASGTSTLSCHTANRTNTFSTMTLMEIAQ